MTTGNQTIGVFILAKNEAANIERSLTALARTTWPVHILDSGSTDGTQTVVGRFPNARVISYRYTDHCSAYNEVTRNLGNGYSVVVVLDADMIVEEDLHNDIALAVADPNTEWDALRAPVRMCVEGHALRHGSLYPPKPMVFKTGKAWFARTGHAERLLAGTRVRDLRHALIHDDRKEYRSYLASQVRYANKLTESIVAGTASRRDRVRSHTPLLIAAVPLFSYIARLGFVSGRAGVIYALDRMIAEAIMYRQAMARQLTHSTIERSRKHGR